jgi:hypothetical protein
MTAGDQFFEALADAVAARVERMLSCKQRLLGIDEAAAYLGFTPVALRHKAGSEIPVVKIDSKLRFDRRDLDRYIDQARREGVG